jgi:hypothetical protein
MLVEFRVNDAPMGSVITGRGKVGILALVSGEAAVDRIELLRNGRVIATYCHAGRWGAEPQPPPVHAKMRVTVGWGPGHEYGLRCSDRRWKGQVAIEGGQISSARGCFTRFGQHLRQISDSAWEWELTTSDRRFSEDNVQGIVFELTGASDSQLSLAVDGDATRFSLDDALRGSRVLPLFDEVRAALENQFELAPQDIPSPDLLYHNAPKIKIHRAVPEHGYTAEAAFSDDPPAGRNYYYLRVSQTNGQMAWSSPIWVER